ncbi:MAG: hypothetical protein P8130_14275 [Deltaproteobacteria bacterium]
MSEDGLTKTAKRVEAIRKILTNSIWILILVIVLATIGRHIVANKFAYKPGPERRPTVKPIEQAIAWDEVDKAVAIAIAEARKNSEAFASRQIDLWIADMMDRVDSDFLAMAIRRQSLPQKPTHSC